MEDLLGSKKEPQTSGGRKSVIIEKDEDHFDDICGQLKPRDNDGGDDGDDENDDEFCPSTNEEAVYEHKQLHKSLGDDPNMDKQMGTEGRTRNAITNSVTKDTDRKYLIDAHNHVETTGKDKNGGNENQSECLINNKCNTEDARYKDNVADCLIGANKEMKYKDENRDKYKDIILGPEALKRPGFNEDNSDGNKDNKENEDTANAGSIDDDEEIHEAHRCIRPNCRQCQFLSQFLVPKPPPPKPLPPSRQKNTSPEPHGDSDEAGTSFVFIQQCLPKMAAKLL
ncbi:hypothetical protein EGW08_012899 [Elysia chlorotica]|uniref:Uncharacterized protein n=1 Tax=Elysia chlorotica TaxID=188477 RepID=A0A433TCN6_ELYCH|nr:hypothetical protein EGW08_012899 [Elysia chlorotica]